MVTGVGTIGTSYIVKDTDVFYYKDASVLCFENRSGILPEFLQMLLMSDYLSNVIRNSSSGTTVATITMKNAIEYLIPLPPVGEQRRAFQRFKEITPLFEDYDALETEREQLDSELPDRLRKSILQMAVQGKLVAQDPSVEPASVLLERIREERRKLIAEGKMKAPKCGESVIYRGSDGGYYEKRIDAKGNESEPVCIDDEIPFEIPTSWEWCRLESIGDWKAGATPAKSNSNYHSNGTIPWLLTGDLNDGFIDEIPNMITELALAECSLRLNPVGTVLVAMYGATIGKFGILGVEATTNQACCGCILALKELTSWMLKWLEFQKPYFIKLGEGGAQPNISREKIVACLFPVPPYAEQERITGLLSHLNI